jgi:hypothetical protein
MAMYLLAIALSSAAVGLAAVLPTAVLLAAGLRDVAL